MRTVSVDLFSVVSDAIDFRPISNENLMLWRNSWNLIFFDLNLACHEFTVHSVRFATRLAVYVRIVGIDVGIVFFVWRNSLVFSTLSQIEMWLTANCFTLADDFIVKSQNS